MIVLDTNVLSELMKPQPATAVMAWADQLSAGAVAITAMNEAVEDKILRKHLPYLKRLAKEHQYATIGDWVKKLAKGDKGKYMEISSRIVAESNKVEVGYTVRGKLVSGTAIDSGAASHVLQRLDYCDKNKTRSLQGFASDMDMETKGT